MTEEELAQLLTCETTDDGTIRVKSREKAAMEFKQDFDLNSFLKCIKTIAAFSNCGGGRIFFGITDRPRTLSGTIGEIDEAEIQNILTNHLHPIPDVELDECILHGKRIVVLNVASAKKPPVIAIKDKQTSEKKNSTVLSQGVIYYRRAGQTRPASGEEFASLLDRRDEATRESILGLLRRGSEIGFENVTVADFRKYGSSEENVTLWVPESAAKELNIIDKAKLVQSEGAPAYQIRGTINLTVPSDKDPRKPLLPRPAARSLRRQIEEIFWPDFPWSEHHLRKVTEHLGFWPNSEGDRTHTGFESITRRPVYYEEGRAAVHRFANRNASDFVEVVGSSATKAEWRRRSAQQTQVNTV